MSEIKHTAAESYTRSGFNTRMGWGQRPALLVIDVCRAYWDESSPLDISSNPAAAAAPDIMRRLLEAARSSGAPVLWTQVSYTDSNMADAGLFWHKAKVLNVWQKGDPRGLDACLEGIEPAEGEAVVVKKYASGFFGTTLFSELQTRNIDTVVICGVSTSGCVRATTLDCMQYGFRPMVVGDACGDRTPEIHDANLFDLNAKYADVVSAEEALESLKRAWTYG